MNVSDSENSDCEKLYDIRTLKSVVMKGNKGYIRLSTEANEDNVVEQNDKRKINLKLIASLVILFTIFATIGFCAIDFLILGKNKMNTNIILDSMNQSIDPCDDFYLYTCDNWQAVHKNKHLVLHNSVLETNSEKILSDSLNFFQKENDINDDPMFLTKIRNMYKACIAIESSDEFGFYQLFDVLKELGLPEFPTFILHKVKNFNNNEYDMTESTYSDYDYYNDNFEFDWISVEAALYKLLNLNLLIGIDILPIFNNTRINSVYLGIPKQKSNQFRSSKKHLFLSNNEFSDLDHLILSTLWKYGFGENNYSSNLIYEVLKAIDFIEKKIQSLIFNYMPSDTFGTYSLSTFPYKTFENKELLNNFFNQVFNEDDLMYFNLYLDEFLCNNIEYYDKMLTFVTNIDSYSLELWMWWKTVKTLIFEIAPGIDDLLQDFKANELVISRNVSCINTVIQFMPYPLLYAINNNIEYTENIIFEVSDILDNIIYNFKDTVENADWLSSTSKALLVEKLNSIYKYIGYPEWIFDTNLMEVFYEDIKISEISHLKNLIAVIKHNQLKKYGKLKKINIRSNQDWPSNPLINNALYIPIENSIVIPYTMLFGLFYKNENQALNYGSIGFVLSHELIHGFDRIGLQYDKNGNFNNKLITELESEYFMTQVNCFIDQYNDYYIPEINKYAESEDTLDENIADNGAIKLAYKAFQSSNDIQNRIYKTEFDKYSDNQLFFISAAHMWCEALDINYMQIRENYDTHSINHVRVVEMLRNSKDFSFEFNCLSKSKMNPIKKCKIW